MYIFYRLLLLLIIISFISCSEKILYSGKIIDEKNFDYYKLKTKEEVIYELGNPNFIDPIENKYYYFSEKKYVKNFFEQKITDRTVVVFIFNENEAIELISQYDLNDEQDVKNIKDTTPNELIKRGLIEKIFGGIGNNIPTTIE